MSQYYGQKLTKNKEIKKNVSESEKKEKTGERVKMILERREGWKEVKVREVRRKKEREREREGKKEEKERAGEGWKEEKVRERETEKKILEGKKENQNDFVLSFFSSIKRYFLYISCTEDDHFQVKKNKS